MIDVNEPLRVVFVCVENACRSQMAEAFTRIHGGDGVVAYSAGSCPSGRANPKAIAAMAELDYDLSQHASNGLADLPQLPFDAAVTMGCGDVCPQVAARNRIEWNIPDPKNMGENGFRRVRDRIGKEVRALLALLREE
ncbi:MAG: arsenate reductase ArsC [Leptospirillia bacterium]